MKKHAIIFVMMFSVIMYSQKKKNGKIYNEHPAIQTVEAMQQAFIKGDTIGLKSYLHDDFKAFNGMNSNPDAKGTSKSVLLRQSIFWVNNASYLSIERTNGAYPDALEYEDNDNKDIMWVQTWDQLKGVHNETGVKLNMPIHRLFRVDKDNKILTMITYDDGTVFDELRSSFVTRSNGTIYNHHDNINKVRRMMAALEHSDVDKAFSYFTEKARFTNLDMKDDEFNTLEQEIEGFKKMLENWTIESIDVNGYPDYLEYELGGGKLVQSWWTARMTRKSDGKKIKLPLMFIHDFNDEGEIISEAGYYTLQALSAK
ncbi:nuclear transport factor 2 family protein [Wocania ichthyoenteri]|uniref:nuclear transport factor 2 family protein n=1 Tax=Wocania ichthyoenteri TaxID=1230531 RepID=UPI00053D3FE3|nr:nuclear transport factor 2 family protein [Wocania ichthyoenteri]